MIDFDALNQQLLAAARDLLPTWLPGGKFKGREYVCGNIQGGDGESFSVNINTGKWADFSNETDRGGDLVSLYAAARGLEQRAAALELGAPDRPNGVQVNGRAAHSALHEPKPDPPTSMPECPPEPYTLEAFRHYKHGLPSAFWVYRSADGAPLYVSARYDLADGKQTAPWMWSGSAWTAKGYPKPRPLYGLENLPPGNSPILLVEGEKTCDAAARHFPEFSCLTWSMGVSNARYADWNPLAERNVTIWPDNDEPGRKAAAQITEILLGLKTTVSVVDPREWPEGWDIADAGPDDDLRAYAAAHVSTVSMPEAITAKPGPAQTAKRLQTSPKPGAVTIDAPAPEHSLYHIYAQYSFDRKTNGRPYCNEHNVRCAIKLKNWDIYFNDFEQRICIGDSEWDDSMTFEFMEFLQHDLELSDISIKTVRDGVTGYAFRHRRNPLVDWLKSLEWDGIMRLPSLIPIGFGAIDDVYTQAVGRCFIVGMIARAINPGCKADCMPVFEGEQGLRKSTALGVLGGAHFSELHDSIMSKDFYISLQGKMLCEISELHAFKTADIERIKGIISNASDRFRAPYGSVATDHPRHGVFAGTTNRDDWNTDETGARRFWPVLCGDVDIDWLIDNREQLFAEAVYRYNDGEKWWDVPHMEAQEARQARQDYDPWEAIIEPYLKRNSVVRTPYIIDSLLEIKTDRLDQSVQRRVTRILRKYGYRNGVRRAGEDSIREWTRKT